MTLVEFHPEATNKAAAARRWYAARSARTAARFADAIDRAIEAIAENPSQAAMYLAGTRRVVLRRFPYLIVYRVSRERRAHSGGRCRTWKTTAGLLEESHLTVDRRFFAKPTVRFAD